MSEKRRLGRGLDALLGGANETEARPSSGRLLPVAVDSIAENPYQPRRDFDPAELESLRQSLATYGMLQPIVVRPVGGGEYQLVAGERRLRAARLAGWTEIPARIVDLDDRQLFEAAMVENLQRADLNPIEKAQGFLDYMTRYDVSQEELARKLGVDRTTVCNLVRLLELPPAVQDAVRSGQISNGHAKALLSLDDPPRQEWLCREIIARGMSVREAEAAVREQRPQAKNPKASPPERTRHVEGIENELRQRLAVRCEIRLAAADRGRIILYFDSNDDFERLVQTLLA